MVKHNFVAITHSHLDSVNFLPSKLKLRIENLSIQILFIKCDKEGYTGDAVNTTCYYDIKTDFQYSFRMKEDIDK